MEYSQPDLMTFMYHVIIIVLFVYCLKMLLAWMGVSEKSPYAWVALGIILFIAYQYFYLPM